MSKTIFGIDREEIERQLIIKSVSTDKNSSINGNELLEVCVMEQMEDVIVRVDKRLLYFNIFHDGMEPNEYKVINGLIIFWILKRHPFCLEVDSKSECY